LLPSLQHKNISTYYITEIIRGNEKTEGNVPIFVITCEDFPSFRIAAKSSTSAWTQLIAQINEFEQNKESNDSTIETTSNHSNEKNEKKSSSKINGLTKMGLKSCDVVRAIEYLPNSERCKNYQFQFRYVKRLESCKESAKTTKDVEGKDKKSKIKKQMGKSHKKRKQQKTLKNDNDSAGKKKQKKTNKKKSTTEKNHNQTKTKKKKEE